MLFNSIEFLIFLSIVFLLYWFAARVRWAQNILLLVSSYVFYGWWDSRFLLLIVLSSVVDYCVGIGIADASSQRRRRLLLSVSLALNLGLLGVFKYYNFFVESFVELLSLFGVEASPARLNVILPVGISFYTFQTLSYSIDIYRKRLQPTRDFVAFCAFVSFFPQLVAGPIERAGHLLPQFLAERRFDYAKAVDGLRQALCGFFKKVVIADNCAIYADQAFNGCADYNSLSLVLGAFCFSLQIYCDFSGYSDIAIGVSRLFGFSLVRNFAFPYFSRDVAEFWRRWHISLSTWFRDYVYIPLGGSQFSRAHTIRNTFVVFIVSGLWHGANWTFVVWGLLNALYVLPLQIAGLNRRFLKPEHGSTKILPTIREAFQIGMTFTLTVLAWVFFRAESLEHAVTYLGRIVACDVASNAIHLPVDLCAIVGGFLVIEWLQRGHRHPLDFSERQISRPRRWAIYYGVIVLILIFGGEQQDFIYFQF
jgi:alginate O-acetyltransferase complex protein AlgI